MKKLLSLVSVLLVFLMLLSACGTPAAETSEPPAEETGTEAPPAEETPAEAEPVTITYCNFNASGGNEETLAKMYEAFHAEYPNITVEIETIGFDDYFTQMQTRVAGGTAPDCYELNIENFASYAAKGALAEITGVDLSGLNETALSAFNVDGKQYGLPGNFSNVVLVTRPAWPIPPTTGLRTTFRPRPRPSAPWATTSTASISPSPTTSSTRSRPSTAAACSTTTSPSSP